MGRSTILLTRPSPSLSDPETSIYQLNNYRFTEHERFAQMPPLLTPMAFMGYQSPASELPRTRTVTTPFTHLFHLLSSTAPPSSGTSSSKNETMTNLRRAWVLLIEALM